MESLLGEGGMGAVYKAFDLELERTLALKVVRPELASPRAMQRFKQELLLASRVSHKNILRIHDLSDWNGVKYITMALVEGTDLGDLMDRLGRLPLERALKFARQLCGALDAAHAENVVHRDLKPQNILIDQTDNVYVSDFGLAKSLEAEITMMTRTGQIMGTPRYMSPEQVDAKEVDARSDLYSLGLILYEMFTGQMPFQGESAMQLMYKRVTERPADPRKHCPDLPEYIARVLLKCLEKDPDKRYSSARQILADLDSQGPAAGFPAGGSSSRLSARRSHDSISIQIRKPSRRTGLIALGVAVALAALGLFPGTRHSFLSLIPGRSGAPSAIQHYVAVLPLTVVGDQAALKYIAEGVVESLSAKLGGLQNVFVADGATVNAAINRGTDENIAKALGVTTLVKGTMQQGANDRLSIILTMNDVTAKRQVMKPAEFAGVRQDLLTLEDNAFKAVADALVIKQSNQERARTSTRPTQDIEAYDLYLKGRNLLRGDRKNAPAALNLFNQAVNRDARFALAYTGIADACLRIWDQTKDSAYTQQAQGAAQQAERLNDSLPEVHFSLGTVYTFTGKPAEAIAELKRAVELAPNSDDGYRRLGKAYKAAGRDKEAIAALEQATHINPYLWSNFNSLGAAYFQAGENRKALEAYRQVTVLDPELPAGWANLGAAYYRLGIWSECVPAFQHAIALRPKAEYYSQLGVASFFQGRFDESVTHFEKAVQLTPKDPFFQVNLADAYRWSSQRDKAAGAYDKAIKLAYESLDVNPKDTEVMGSLAIAYARKGDDANALKFIRQARQIKPDDPDLLDFEAQIHTAAGRTSEALASLKLAVKSGYSLEEIRSNPEFKGLRDKAEFQLLQAQAPPKVTY